MDRTNNGESQPSLHAAPETESSSSMAATAAAPSSSNVYGLSSVLLPPRLRGVSSSFRVFSLLKPISAPILRRCFLTRLLLSPPPSATTSSAAAAAAAAAATSTAFVDAGGVVEKEEVVPVNGAADILACPVCYAPLSLMGDSVLSMDSAGSCSLQCGSCKKTYSGKDAHLELTVVARASADYGEAMPLATEIFRLRFVSYLYERGWRQNFFLGGFPGPEKEFELMKDYLRPVMGGNIVDASCGSGMFSRLFAKSGLFSPVVALDYSENMLQQCYDFIKQEQNFPKEKLILVRADIARLPFLSNSVDAVHAGAAIHCWPSPTAAVAEVCRVLKPGGVFVGTTAVFDGIFRFASFLRPLRLNFMQLSGYNVFISESQLEDICRACGLVDFTCTRNRRFIMFTARKAS